MRGGDDVAVWIVLTELADPKRSIGRTGLLVWPPLLPMRREVLRQML